MDDNSDLMLEFQQIADPKQLSLLEKIHARLDNLLDSVQGFNVVIPKIFQVFGRVSVDKVDQLPPVKVQNFSELYNPLTAIAHGIADLKASIKTPQNTNTTFPTDFTVTNEVKIKQFTELLDGVEELIKGFNLLINKETATVSFPSNTIPVEIQNWKIPQPVTNISLNALQGFSKTTTTTVGTNPISLPSYGQLFNRRTLVAFNNGVNTVYIGGSDVTVNNGLPIVPQTFSPAIDAGYNMVIYGVTSTGTSDVRVMEVSKDQTANVQE